MFNIKQAAKELAISNALMYALIAAKKIRHERHGLGRGTIRISRKALEEYRLRRTIEVEKSTTPTPAPSPSTAAPFSDLDPERLRRAWKAD